MASAFTSPSSDPSSILIAWPSNVAQYVILEASVKRTVPVEYLAIGPGGQQLAFLGVVEHLLEQR